MATVLVVDDTGGYRHIIEAYLLAEGYKVLAAQNGAEAIQILERHSGPIHLPITDSQMPGMTGPQLAQHVSRRHPQTRILCISGEPRDVTLETTIPFLQKPVDRQTLLKAVQEMLSDGK
jgi:two-component system, cell cycle sensor histidine kinase and response regulator CckA